MTTQTTTSALWALLIGVDYYMGRTIPGLPNYGSLSGCVNDIALMDEFLRTRLNVPGERIIKLTASGYGVQPQEPLDAWPTKANIVAAFRRLTQAAQPGDQVYIHYSGHGGRALTLYPEVKGQGRGVYDESLVPTDYGQIENKEQPEDRYLRDLELAYLLQEMVDRELIVTTVLDSCHSGGATRGAEEDATARGGLEPDEMQRAPTDLVAPPAELAASWLGQAGGAHTSAVASGWLPEPNGYTLLAACRALELAQEYPAPNGKNHGALTYWLAQTPGLNWEAVHQQVVARVWVEARKRGEYQTPQLQGVGDRAVFGGARLALPIGVNVLEVQDDRLRLSTGQAAGAASGAQYFVYRQGVTNFKQTGQRVAVAALTEVHDAESWAWVVRRLDGEAAIEPGAQALLFDPGHGQQRAVRWARGGPAAAEVQEEALAGLTAAIQHWEGRFIRLAAEDEAAAFQVGLNAAGAYELRDGGGRPLANVSAVPLDDPDEVVYRLDHLARYLNVLELGSPDALSRLAGKLEIKLLRTPEEPFAQPGGIPAVAEGQLYYLRIRNLFEPMQDPPSDAPWYIEELRRRTLNVTVLNLAPDWSIQRLIPADDQKQFELGPGETLLLDQGLGQRALPAFNSSAPAGMSEADDIFKVFATTETTSYDTLQLPPLEGAGSRASLATPKTQDPERSWITAQLMVRVVKP